MPKKIPINDLLFTKLNKEALYWLGMLSSDGSVDKNRVSLRLIDKEHLIKYKMFLQSNLNLQVIKGKKYTHNTQYSIRFSSKKIAKTLYEYGIVPNKSNIAKVDQRLRLSPDFWRGMIDGDGCILKHPNGYPVVMMNGTADVCNSFIDFIKTFTPQYRGVPAQHGNIWRVNLCGHRAIRLLKKLYYGGCVALERKCRIVESFAEERKAKWDLRYLHLAKYISSWSKDPTTKVGAVIVRKDNTICSTGFNGFPKGTDDHPSLYRNRKQKLLRTVHAEMNALLFSRDTSLEDYILYTYPFEPCSNCAAAIIQSGITRIVTIPPSKELEERWNESLFEARSMFEQSGIVIDYVDDLEELCN